MRVIFGLAKFVGYVTGALLVWFILAPIGEVVRNQITVYPITTADNGRLMTLNRTTFRVYLETQTIVSWMPDFPGSERLKNCVVRDRRNWRGEVRDGSLVYEMNDGKLEWIENGNRTTPFTYVSRLEWWRLYLKAMF